MFKLFLVFILISTASLLCRASEGCNPVAQLAYIGTLHSQSVQFQPFYRQISFASAQINTINCREKKQLLKNNKYKEIQSLHASGDLVFVTVNQQGDSRCMLDLVNGKTLFTKS